MKTKAGEKVKGAKNVSLIIKKNNSQISEDF
jgi:hypothetical protein